MKIETTRLRLREFTYEDWESVLRYHSDPRYLRYYTWKERTEKDVQAFVQLFLEQQQQEPRTKFQLAIIHKETGRLIGNCGIRRDAVKDCEAEIGYELAPDFWGAGYATEAAREMVNVGFGDWGIHRIWANCVAENSASARVLGRLGMQLEGRLRDKEYFKNRWWDVLVYGLLESEWTANC